jgi:hypothetical protein
MFKIRSKTFASFSKPYNSQDQFWMHSKWRKPPFKNYRHSTIQKYEKSTTNYFEKHLQIVSIDFNPSKQSHQLTTPIEIIPTSPQSHLHQSHSHYYPPHLNLTLCFPNDDESLSYIDIRIMCPAKTYSQLSTNSQSSGKKHSPRSEKSLMKSKVFEAEREENFWRWRRGQFSAISNPICIII